MATLSEVRPIIPSGMGFDRISSLLENINQGQTPDTFRPNGMTLLRTRLRSQPEYLNQVANAIGKPDKYLLISSSTFFNFKIISEHIGMNDTDLQNMFEYLLKHNIQSFHRDTLQNAQELLAMSRISDDPTPEYRLKVLASRLQEPDLKNSKQSMHRAELAATFWLLSERGVRVTV